MRNDKYSHKRKRKGLSLGLLFLLSTTFFIASCSSLPIGLTVGDQAPDFKLPTASGGVISLADYSGNQPVLLYFHMAVG